MRETTRLLCAHVLEPLAELIESYFMPASDEEYKEPWQECYLTVLDGHMELSMQYTTSIHADHGLQAACHRKSMDLIHAFINAGAVTNYDNAFCVTLCYVDDIDHEITDLLISHGADPCNTFIMYMCAKSGKIEACRYLVDHGSTHYNDMLKGGCASGRMDIVQLAITLGADNWDDGLSGAASSGDLGMCVLILQFGSDLNWGLYSACSGGQLNVARRMVARGATHINGGLHSACSEKQQSLIKYMIQCGATSCQCGRSIAEH